MRSVSILVVFIVAVIFFSPMLEVQGSSDQVSKIGNVHNGEAVFLQKCFQCHSVIEGQARLGPNLYGLMKKPHPRKTDSDVRFLLKNGQGKMPSFADTLTQEDEDNLIAYLHSI